MTGAIILKQTFDKGHIANPQGARSACQIWLQSTLGRRAAPLEARLKNRVLGVYGQPVLARKMRSACGRLG